MSCNAQPVQQHSRANHDILLPSPAESIALDSGYWQQHSPALAVRLLHICPQVPVDPKGVSSKGDRPQNLKAKLELRLGHYSKAMDPVPRFNASQRILMFLGHLAGVLPLSSKPQISTAEEKPVTGSICKLSLFSIPLLWTLLGVLPLHGFVVARQVRITLEPAFTASGNITSLYPAIGTPQGEAGKLYHMLIQMIPISLSCKLFVMKWVVCFIITYCIMYNRDFRAFSESRYYMVLVRARQGRL